MYLDSHIHFWKLIRNDYGWLTPNLLQLYHDFLPAEFEQLLLPNGVDGVIVVQAASTVAETEFLLLLAEQYDWIYGVVGWLAIGEEGFITAYERLRQNPYFVGIRLGSNELKGSRDTLSPHLKRDLSVLAADRFPIDLLCSVSNMPDVLAWLEQVPGLRAVINHLGGPNIKGNQLQPWLDGIKQVAGYPNVMCKLSGMITQMEPTDIESLRPFVEELYQWFGAERLMFGSDWPVSLLAGSYEEVVQLFEQILPGDCGLLERMAIRSGNAAQFYLKGGH